MTNKNKDKLANKWSKLTARNYLGAYTQTGASPSFGNNLTMGPSGNILTTGTTTTVSNTGSTTAGDYTWDLQGSNTRRQDSTPFSVGSDSFSTPSSVLILNDMLSTIYFHGRKNKDNVLHTNLMAIAKEDNGPKKLAQLILKPLLFSAQLSKTFYEIDFSKIVLKEEESIKEFNEEQTLLNGLANTLFEKDNTTINLIPYKERKELIEQLTEISKATELLMSDNKGDAHLGEALLLS